VLVAACLAGLPNLARAHGPLDEQLAAVTREIWADPDNASLFLRRAELMRLNRAWEGARVNLDRAANLDPTLAEVALFRAALFFDQGDAAAALRSVDRLLSERPDAADGFLVRARANEALGRRSDAALDLRRAIALLKPPRPEHYLDLARLIGDEDRAGGSNEALAVLDDGIARLGPIVSLEFAAIDLEVRGGRTDAALGRLDHVADQFDRKDEIVARRAAILAAAGGAIGAAPETRAVAKAHPAAIFAPEPPAVDLPGEAGGGEAGDDVEPELAGIGREPPVVPASATPLPRNSVWRYDATGTDLATSWRESGFDASAWPSGPGVLGFGDAFIATAVPFGPDPSNKYRTTYFRTTFNVPDDPATITYFNLAANYDDGFVAYVNGVEVARRAMPAGAIVYSTAATIHEGGAYESIDLLASASALVLGTNVIAVEVHQVNATSSDLAWDGEIAYSMLPATVTRGPYLQLGTPTSAVLRWRTDAPTDSRVEYGTAVGSLGSYTDDATVTTEHAVTISGLLPDTKYYYSIGTTTVVLEGDDANHFVVTSPAPGSAKPTRVWILGDSGLPGAVQNSVRDAYAAYTGSTPTDFVMMLGDNAYNTGLDAEYQSGLFDPYEVMLRKAVLWPTRGNHDVLRGGGNNDYYDFFTMPTAAEAGGVASGSEAYYSFDYGNIHFICLDSEGTDRSPGGAMMTWLKSDLGASTKDWNIAFWHHPPYTKGSHDSDNDGDSGGRMRDMRQNALPILDTLGVDLVFTGHSHSYERSVLLKGHYGKSPTLDPPTMVLDGGSGRFGTVDGPYAKTSLARVPLQGIVHTVAGSSAQTSGGSLNYPAMYVSVDVAGSMVLDVNGNRLDARFITSIGAVQDSFTVFRGPPVSVGHEDGSQAAPSSLRLDPAQPNPFGSRTRFSFALARPGRVSLSIVDLAGRRVAVLVEEARSAGPHSAVWDGTDARGRRVAPGAYFGVLESENESRRAKIVLVR